MQSHLTTILDFFSILTQCHNKMSKKTVKVKGVPYFPVQIEKGRAISDPASLFRQFGNNYFLNFLLMPTSPSRPEPNSQTAPGMGTGELSPVSERRGRPLLLQFNHP